MVPKILPSQAYLCECLRYTQETGELVWRERPASHFQRDADRMTWNTKFSSRIAGSFTNTGHRVICLDYERYLIHRVVWKMIFGTEPPPQIDHKNVDPSDNRLENIRTANDTQNRRNSRVSKNNSSGFKGVHFAARQRKFIARIHINKIQIHIGTFDDPRKAHEAYCAAARVHFGEYWNAG